MAEQVFVARERELTQLHTFLDRTLIGQGQVVFVTGEAGSGKTALVTEFARRAQEAYADLVVAVGQGDAQTGIGDPYLPFREVLGLLTGDVEAKLVQGAITQENAGRLQDFLRVSGQALVEYGPDLIDIFVPGGALATRAAGRLAQRTGWLDRLEQLTERKAARAGETDLDQSRIFEQYTNVLTALAAQQPLMLVVDDLQWADATSIELLFRLGRRIGEGRILVVGTYRPDDVALGRSDARHPLEPVLNEMKRYYGDVWVDLGQAGKAEGRQFVDALLDIEPNHLGEGFRQALLARTGGHPLFTVELLQDMQERGDLIQNEEGQWIEGSTLDWDTLPARVEGVIGERIGRLEEELRETLMVASVEGEDFTAEVVARVRAVDERGLVRRLGGELDKQYRLVGAQGVRRVGRQRLSLYRFRHNLFQEYLYNSLDEVERSYLHEDVGTVLEELYGDQAEKVAVQLAYHFVAADMQDKAVHYLYLAGEQARRQYANDEAVKYLSRALDLVSEDDLSRRYDLLLTRVKLYDHQGMREAQREDLAALQRIVDFDDDTSTITKRRAEVALHLARYSIVTGDYPTAISAAQKAVELAETCHAVELEAEGHRVWGFALWWQAQLKLARPRFEQALTLSRTAGLRRTEAKALESLAATGMFSGSRATDIEGYCRQTLAIYQEIGDRVGESAMLNKLGYLPVAQGEGEYGQARAYYEDGLHISLEIGSRLEESLIRSNLGVLCDCQGNYAQAMSQLEQAVRVAREIQDIGREGTALCFLGHAYFSQGDYVSAEESYKASLDILQETGNRQFEVRALSDLGLLYHCLRENATARTYTEQAVRIAQDFNDPRQEGYVLTRLGHALVGLGELQSANEAYQRALTLHREMEQFNRSMEPLAGLARVWLAQAWVEEILDHLATKTLDKTEEAFWVHVTCYRVLSTVGDPRAQDVLRTAYGILRGRAATIEDEAGQRMFWEDVATHREIARAWADGGYSG